MSPVSQRGNFSYLAHPGPGAGSSATDYKAQIMAEKEVYWLEHPWKNATWGDAQGNRANRYLGVVANLDGAHTYAVSQRGYYQRTTFAAYRIVNRRVKLQARFDSDDRRYWSLGGTAHDDRNRGNHFTDSADLDGDGRDEVVMKAMVLGLSAGCRRPRRPGAARSGRRDAAVPTRWPGCTAPSTTTSATAGSTAGCRVRKRTTR